MAQTKHSAVWEWLQSCPHITDLFFNYAQVESNSTELIPSEQIAQENIDGSKLMYYDVSLIRYLLLSDVPNDRSNIEDLVDFEKVAEWIDAQMAAGNLPEFPANCLVTEITVLPNNAGFMVAKDMMHAKYMIQFRIEYERSMYHA